MFVSYDDNNYTTGVCRRLKLWMGRLNVSLTPNLKVRQGVWAGRIFLYGLIAFLVNMKIIYELHF